MSRKTKDIEQIIPAGDWIAMFHNGEGQPYFRPIICLALVRLPNGDWMIDGVNVDRDNAQDLCSDLANFECLVRLEEVEEIVG